MGFGGFAFWAKKTHPAWDGYFEIGLGFVYRANEQSTASTGMLHMHMVIIGVLWVLV